MLTVGFQIAILESTIERRARVALPKRLITSLTLYLVILLLVKVGAMKLSLVGERGFMKPYWRLGLEGGFDRAVNEACTLGYYEVSEAIVQDIYARVLAGMVDGKELFMAHLPGIIPYCSSETVPRLSLFRYLHGARRVIEHPFLQFGDSQLRTCLAISIDELTALVNLVPTRCWNKNMDLRL